MPHQHWSMVAQDDDSSDSDVGGAGEAVPLRRSFDFENWGDDVSSDGGGVGFCKPERPRHRLPTGDNEFSDSNRSSRGGSFDSGCPSSLASSRSSSFDGGYPTRIVGNLPAPTPMTEPPRPAWYHFDRPAAVAVSPARKRPGQRRQDLDRGTKGSARHAAAAAALSRIKTDDACYASGVGHGLPVRLCDSDATPYYLLSLSSMFSWFPVLFLFASSSPPPPSSSYCASYLLHYSRATGLTSCSRIARCHRAGRRVHQSAACRREHFHRDDIQLLGW